MSAKIGITISEISMDPFLIAHENFIEVSNNLSRELSSSKGRIKEA